MTPERVRIREVGPRDGFQNEPEIVPTDEKVRLVDLLARSGVRRLEVTSFVRAVDLDVVAGVRDHDEVLSGHVEHPAGQLGPAGAAGEDYDGGCHSVSGSPVRRTPAWVL